MSELLHYPGCVWFCGPTHAAHQVEQRIRCMCERPRKRGSRCRDCGQLLRDVVPTSTISEGP